MALRIFARQRRTDELTFLVKTRVTTIVDCCFLSATSNAVDFPKSQKLS
jgi:hypothetical protein